MLDDEQFVRRTIEQMIADWDTAFADGNPDGMTGHFVPEEPRRVEKCRQAWANVMEWTEDAKAHSTIQEFCFHGEKATVVAEQKRSFCFSRPPSTFALAGWVLLGWFSRFVFVEREVSRSEWRKTPEGWLCEADKRLSYRVRIRRRVLTIKPEPPSV